MSLGAEMRASAATVVREAGRMRKVTLHRITSADDVGTYDPTTGIVSGEEVDDDTLAYAEFLAYSQRYVDGVNVRQGDQRVLFTAPQRWPALLIGDQIEADDQLYAVVNVTKVEASGVVLKYECQVRNA